MIPMELALRRRLMDIFGGGNVKQATGTLTVTTASDKFAINVGGLDFIPKMVIEYGLSGIDSYLIGITLLDEDGSVRMCRSRGNSSRFNASDFVLSGNGFSWAACGWSNGTVSTIRWIAFDTAVENVF